MFKRIVGLVMVFCLLSFSGCATLAPSSEGLDAKAYFDRYQHIMKLAVQVAVLRVLNSNPTYADSMIALVEDLKIVIDALEILDLAELEQVIKDRIDWSKFQPTEKLLVEALISQVRVEIDNVIAIKLDGIPTPSGDVKFIVTTFVDWVAEAAMLHKQQQSNRSVIPEFAPIVK